MCSQKEASHLQQARLEVLYAFRLADPSKQEDPNPDEDSKSVVVEVHAPLRFPEESAGNIGDGSAKEAFAKIIKLFRAACVLDAPQEALMEAQSIFLQKVRLNELDHEPFALQPPSDPRQQLWGPHMVSCPTSGPLTSTAVKHVELEDGREGRSWGEGKLERGIALGRENGGGGNRD